LTGSYPVRTLDEGLAEAISSLLWVAPRLQTDVAEMKVIADLLTAKYGRQYADVSVVICAESMFIKIYN
jgi:vacuolar protein sorting-associated protein IST1